MKNTALVLGPRPQKHRTPKQSKKIPRKTQEKTVKLNGSLGRGFARADLGGVAAILLTLSGLRPTAGLFLLAAIRLIV